MAKRLSGSAACIQTIVPFGRTACGSNARLAVLRVGTIGRKSQRATHLGSTELFCRRGRRLFIPQTVQMRYKITHMCVVYRALRFGFPSIKCCRIVWEYADDVDIVHVLESVLAWIDQLAAEHKMQPL